MSSYHVALRSKDDMIATGGPFRGSRTTLAGAWGSSWAGFRLQIAFHALCGRGMVGVSGNKNGRKIPYYVCNGRLSKTGCTMAYIRADLLEEQIIEGFQDLFRSEVMLERVVTVRSRPS